MVDAVVHKVATEVSFGLVDTQSKTTVKDEGVKTELSDTLRAKNLKRNKSESKKDNNQKEAEKQPVDLTRVRNSLTR